MAKPAGPCDVTMGVLLTVTKPLLPLLPLLLLLHPASTVTDVPPRIIEAPISQKVADMGKVSFVCRASGHPAPTFHWERNRKRLTKNRNRYKVVEAPQMSVLRIEPVRGKRDHNMVISCVADNGLGQARAEATLTVYVKDNGKAYPHGYPLITAHPKLKSVEKGLSTLLQCETSGNPAPVVTWFKDMLPLDFSDPRITLLSNGYLQIQNSQESDEATYECVAHNDLGVTYSYPAMMYVKVRRVPPRFIKEMANDVTAMPGSDVNLTCVAVGSPMPEVRWRHGAEVLTPEGAVPVGRNVLELRDVRQSANYTCEASSDLGNIEHVVTLRLQAPGSAPRDLRAFAASATTVELSWKPPQIPNDVIQGYRVFYTLQPESPVVFWEQKKVGAGQHKTTLSQLAPNVTYTIAVLAFSPSGPGPLSHPLQVLTKRGDRGTTYEFRVSAKNGVDYGERAVVTIETPEGAPSGTPQNFSGTGLTESSVRLQWDPPARPLQNGRIMQYQLTYRRVSDGLQDQRQVNVTDTWAKLTSLDSNTDYIVQIRAFTARGGGPWSNRLHFRTFGNMPSAPKQVSVRRTSPTSVEVTWEEVGDGVAGYRVFYNTFSTQAMDAWQYLDTGPYTVLDLTGLDPHTVYAVRVQARSVDGRYGNLSETVTTDVIEIERDDMVQNFRVTSRLTNVVRLAWSPPKKENVSIYLLRYSGLKTYREAGQTKVVLHEPEEVRIPGQKTSWTVKKLQPKMRLVFNITAFFPKSDTMGPVAHVVTETLIDAPPRVEAPVVEEREGVTIQLRLRPASERNGPLSHYHLVVVPRKARPFGTLPSDFTVEELMNEGTGPDQPYIAARFEAHALLPYFLLGDGQEYGAFFNRPLLSDRTYRVFLRAYSVDQRLYTSSPYSEHLSVSPAHRQSPAGSGNPHSPSPPHAPGRKGGRGRGKGRAGGVSGTRRQEPSPGPLKDSDMLLTIVAPTCSLALLLLCGAALAVYCRMRRGRHSKSVLLEEEERRGLVMEVPPCVADPVQMRRQHYQTAAMMSHPPVPVERLAEHINLLKAAENLRFSQEYESIDPGQQFTWESSSLEVNKAKNRYANVIAYDHSRVVLAEVKGVAGSDYVNANYNDGYRRHNAYIATQGPLPETFGDFWRMVWEQRSTTVVMMTRLQERSRIKCDQYWPSRGAETYGLMHVQLLDVTELAIYTVRLFQLSKLGSTEKREVRQFQFTAWPDHGVPDHPTPLLLFLRRVKASLPTESGPLVVHCSAGVGRTGAFIVIDAMLERLRHEKTVDVYGHVTCLRAQRNYMVQTEEQYMFIHDAVLEAVQCTHTDIPARLLANHVTGLTQPLPGHTLCPMELEFQRLSNMKASPNRFVSANLPVNKFKNRLVNILPYETTRVCLQPIRGVDGSDYINASYIDGYRYKKAYIATQGPLAETREDLWRMLWEQNSCIIVNLTKLREMGREMCQQYWPTDRSARYQYFVVDPMTEYNMPHYILREFKVTDARDGQSRTIRQFHFTDWPEQGVPKCGEAFIDFIGQVHKTKEQFGHEGPITVHCSAGVGRTGVFIALSIVLDRMRAEGLVDLVHTVKMLRTQRPAMVHTQDQFQFCYRAALEYLGSFDHYAH